MNPQLAQHIIEQAISNGVQEFCVAPGSRNSPLVYALSKTKQAKIYYWSEERSAAFFAIGRMKVTERPVAVIVTSGTAAAELLPAAMTAHYLGLPLLMITADRPRRFRTTGAPQTAEQEHLFGCYAHFEKDLAFDGTCDLSQWSCKGPAHLNVCFEEPNETECQTININQKILVQWPRVVDAKSDLNLEPFIQFIEKTNYPLVVVGSLPEPFRETAVQFLLKLGAPIYAEGTSHLREDPRLASLRVHRVDKLWQKSAQHRYPVDGILRLGEVPTARLWRDLEEQLGKIAVCSISDLPFSGLSWAGLICVPFANFFELALNLPLKKEYKYAEWLTSDHTFQRSLESLFQEEPQAEPSLFYQLSSQLNPGSNIYLGNSLPIREWDLAATYEDKKYRMFASRGVNGIDGQISTFLGLSEPGKDNWAILGDLTVLYDMAGPWILSQIKNIPINLVVINNKGGQIFSRMYSLPGFTNSHQLEFKHLAAFWKMKYEVWESIPESIISMSHISMSQHRLIEIAPNAQATERFWKKMSIL